MMERLVVRRGRCSKEFSRALVVLLCFFSISIPAETIQQKPKVLEVGVNKEYLFPSVAAEFVSDGDIVEIDANGFYENDTVTWSANNLLIRGVNGRPHISSRSNIKNGKAIWIIKGNNIRIENFEFSGAKVSHKNGAAIRVVGKNFYLSDCYIHNNENGILSGKNKKSEIVIENCEFSYNGRGKGRTHNIYIGKIKSFTLINSFSHHAYVGHNVKSRAETNNILYNRIMDFQDGRSSYSIDLPSGGTALVLGNIIQQSPATKNSAIVSFGAEGLIYKKNKLRFFFNTVINNRSAGIFIKVKSNARAIIKNNIFSGNGKLVKGEVILEHNILNTAKPMFKSADTYNYEILAASPAVDQAVAVVDNKGVEVLPEYHFYNGKWQRRSKAGQQYDLGAIEYIN